jgi:signal transduction histidine kinase
MPEMSSRSFKLSLKQLLVLALLILLPLLATLQYRWLGQVSQAEYERIQGNLRAGASQFSKDFDREIGRAYLNFKIDQPGALDETWRVYAQRHNHWFKTAPYPELVSDLFWVDDRGSEGIRLAHFKREANQFRFGDWPAELEELRQQFGRQYGESSTEVGSIILASPLPIEERLPALILPVLISPSEPATAKTAAPLHLAYVIVKLNLDYIKQEYIPMLANRYFAYGNKRLYDLAVVSNTSPTQIICQLGTSFDQASLSSADVSVGILDIRLQDILSLSVNEVPQVGLPSASPGGFKSFAVRTSGAQRQGTSPELDLSSNDLGNWKLLLKHQSGSLEDSINHVRYRNLAISFGILLLLAVSIIMMVVSTRRAQQLADLQIDFVARVSHELRTPLAIICSTSQNLSDGLVKDRERVELYGSVINKEGHRLAEMVEGVLEFAGIRSGKVVYHFKSERVQTLIESALSDLSALIAEKGFSIEKHIPAALPDVFVDSSALIRAIQNLVNNAIKYSGDSRWIGIKAAQRAADLGKVEVAITVEDKGIGIPQSELAQIFDSFYRSREAVNSQIRGSGLGLSLVKGVVEAHGGRITVESTIGQGSSFTLHLPVAPAEEPAFSESEATV